MGKIQQFSKKTEIRISVEEILTARVAVDRAVTFTLAEMISMFARMKAEEKKVDLPGGVIATSFDPASSEFIVTFSNSLDIS